MIETERLILREMELVDVEDLFEMDVDPDVHIFIENKPDKNIEETKKSILYFKQKAKEDGFPVYSVIDKVTNECIGWAGLMLSREIVKGHINIFELGYRFKKKHWGKGYATEASNAVLKKVFEELPINLIFAFTDDRNNNSKKVLLKLNFELRETFELEGQLENWFALTKENWELNN